MDSRRAVLASARGGMAMNRHQKDLKIVFARMSCLCMLMMAGCANEPDPSGPAPVAVIEPEYHDAGKIVVGSSVERKFRITNQGEALLELVEITPMEEPPDCRVELTVSKRKIPPGDSATLTLGLTPQSPREKLRKGVYIKTNERNLAPIRVGIYAEVAPLLEFETEKEQRFSGHWSFERGNNGEPLPFRADLYSVGLEQFEILKIETTPDFACRFRKLNPEEREELQAKSGYELTVDFANKEFVGIKRGRLTVTTDVAADPILSVDLKASRYGPMHIVPDPDSPWRWDYEKDFFAMESFSSEKGTSAMARIFFSQPKHGDWAIEAIECDIPHASVAMNEGRVANSQAMKQFELVLTLPPRNQADARVGDNSAYIIIRTTHPAARYIRLPIQYVSTGS